MPNDLLLRSPTPEDAQALLDAVRESAAEVGRWMDWCRPDYSLEDAASWIRGQAEGRERGTAFEFLVVDQADRIKGVCGVNGANALQAGMANLGYWVRTSETGRGVATQAVRMLANWVFDNTELQRLEIVVAVGNATSQRVAEKAGALREGVLRARLRIHGAFHDAVMYSLVRPEPAHLAGM
ncbi:MAG: GNAT family N-acetyltransferase [Thermoanaerobaculaceae bacterium]